MSILTNVLFFIRCTVIFHVDRGRGEENSSNFKSSIKNLSTHRDYLGEGSGDNNFLSGCMSFTEIWLRREGVPVLWVIPQIDTRIIRNKSYSYKRTPDHPFRRGSLLFPRHAILSQFIGCFFFSNSEKLLRIGNAVARNFHNRLACTRAPDCVPPYYVIMRDGEID